MAWTYIHAAFRVVLRPGLTPGSRLLLLQLANKVDARGRLAAELVELQRWTRLSRRGVQVAMSNLCDLGLLKVERKHNHKNRFSLPFDPYEIDGQILHPDSPGAESAPDSPGAENAPDGVQNAPPGAFSAPAIIDPYSLLGSTPVSDEVAARVVQELLSSSRDGHGVPRVALGASSRASLTAKKLALVRDSLARNPATLDEIKRIGALIAATELFAYLRVVPITTIFQSPSKHRQDHFELALLQARSPVRLARLAPTQSAPRASTPKPPKPARPRPVLEPAPNPQPPPRPAPDSVPTSTQTASDRQLDLFGETTRPHAPTD